MSTVHIDEGVLHVPVWVNDLESFRRWATSDESPEKGLVGFWNGKVWFDVSKEQIFSHNQVKNEYSFVLTGLVRQVGSGRYLPDGWLFTNVTVEVSCHPDGGFISNESIESGRVRFVGGLRRGFVELEGSPDMLLEVVSDSSVNKDNHELMQLYFEAGVDEYWLVDARGSTPSFQIHLRRTEGYEPAAPDADGWMHSGVFDRRFRLTQDTDRFGHPVFTLEVQAP